MKSGAYKGKERSGFCWPHKTEIMALAERSLVLAEKQEGRSVDECIGRK